jgi:hypothetical protein
MKNQQKKRRGRIPILDIDFIVKAILRREIVNNLCSIGNIHHPDLEKKEKRI